jgi:hypothetical protein
MILPMEFSINIPFVQIRDDSNPSELSPYSLALGLPRFCSLSSLPFLPYWKALIYFCPGTRMEDFARPRDNRWDAGIAIDHTKSSK